MTMATARSATEYVNRVSAIASSNASYLKRHKDDVTTVNEAVKQSLDSREMASGLELVERSAICDLPGGYQVWELRRASAALTFERLIRKDPLAKDIDFSREIRAGLARQ